MRTLIPVLVLASLGLSAEAPVTYTRLLRTNTTWDGAPIRPLAATRPEVKAILMEIAPGAANTWHKHTGPTFAYVLQGDFRVELDNGTTRDFCTGEAYAQVVDTWHRGLNVGTVPLKVLVFFAGETGVPKTINRVER